jgi:ankyrin repeat protein
VSGALTDALQRSDFEQALGLLKSAKLEPELRAADNPRKFTVLHTVAEAFPYVQKPPPVLLEVAGLLLDKGAEIDARDLWNETPLMVAFQHFRLSLAELFIDRGGDVLAVDDKGLSVLHWACCRASGGAHGEHLVKVVARLLEAGADPTLRCRKSNAPYFIDRGASPLKLAQDGTNPALVKLLEAAIAKRDPAAGASPKKTRPAARRK